MSDIIFEVLKLAVMIAALVIVRYVVPWIRTKIDNETLSLVTAWVAKAVRSTQQVMDSGSGAEKKAIVTEFLKEVLTAKNISLSDSQLETLIEAAVRQMKMEENIGAEYSLLPDDVDNVEAECRINEYPHSHPETDCGHYVATGPATGVPAPGNEVSNTPPYDDGQDPEHGSGME